MAYKNFTSRAPMIVSGISTFVIVFVYIAINTDFVDFRIPVPVFDNHYDRSSFSRNVQYSQPLAKNKTTLSTISGIKAAQSTTDAVEGLKNMTTHVAFLKVHKAGSTTMQNLFFRFGLRHNLNILLPRSGYQFHTPTSKIPLKPGEHYDIFALHTVYGKKWFDSLLPADSVNIGIVREPVSRMISSAYYNRDVYSYAYLRRIPAKDFIHNLVNFPEKYESGFFSQTRNVMGKDFGFQRDIQMTNKSRIRSYLDSLNSEFLLVLIMEKFDESLVMMKRLLYWSFIDIIYLKTNSNKHSSVVLNKTEKAKFRNTSFLDFEIYEYFAGIFEKKLKNLGDGFHDEVAFFKTLLKQVNGFCLKKDKIETAELSFEQSKWDGKVQVRKSDCGWMQTEELAFIDKLRPKYLRSAQK